MDPTFKAYSGNEPFAFLSYAHADSKTVMADAAWLDENGVRIWYDAGIRGGRQWAETIREKIRRCYVVLLFLSPAALRERSDDASESYVFEEIRLAQRYRKPFIVILLEPLTLPAKIEFVHRWEEFFRYSMEPARYLTQLRDDSLDAQLDARHVSRWKRWFHRDAGRFRTLEKLVHTIDKSLIRGFLTPTLSDALKIDPPMIGLWANGRSREIPSEFLRKSFFSECGVGLQPRLLISGGPGSGKSIQMLKFVDALLIRGGRLSDKSKIPVVLNASSWVDDPIRMRNKGSSIQGWIETQLLSQYGIPKLTGAYLIQNCQLIYCIDGFDEIGRARETKQDDTERSNEEKEVQEARCRALRKGFLDLLEPFLVREEGAGAGCILCSRPGPAQELRERTALEFCEIRIGELTEPVVLEAIRKNHLDLVEQFADHPGIRDLLKSPLGLQMLAVAYPQGTPVEAGYEILDRTTVDEVQSKVYRRFFAQKVTDFQATQKEDEAEGVTLDMPNYKIQQSAYNIAGYLMNRGRELTFRMDELQPYELPVEGYTAYRRLAALMLMGTVAVCAGVPVGIAVGTDRYFSGERLSAIGFGLLTVVGIGGVAAGTAAYGYRRFRGAGAGAFIGVAFAMGRGFGVGFSARVAGSESGLRAGLKHGLATLAIMPVFAVLFHFVKEKPMEIIPIETWETDRSTALVAAIATAGAFGVVFNLLLGPARGISFGVCLAFAMVQRFARKPREAPLKVSPNQAIDYTRKVAVTNAVGITAASMTVFGVVYGKYFDRREGVNNAVMAMTFLISFFFFGGLPVLKHFALRRTLRKLKLIPEHDLRFLETAAKVGMMRKVGGSFVFPHDSITKYFADQNPNSTWGKAKDPGSA